MTNRFDAKHLPNDADEIAPDGSEVRLLLTLDGGGMAHFTIPAGHTIRAVRHQTVEEIWYIVSGRGDMWRSLGDAESVVTLEPGLAVSIPVGTTFQVKNTGTDDICVVGQTMPAWPGNDEAIVSEGPWTPTLGP
jgi:mannose-6-phosphate isomerase-like protein (cupin superfamily)